MLRGSAVRSLPVWAICTSALLRNALLLDAVLRWCVCVTLLAPVLLAVSAFLPILRAWAR